MSDTPRTDALLRELQPANSARELDLARLGRQLERELSTLRSAVIEECAKVCDDTAVDNDGTDNAVSAARECADRVRALHTQGKPNEQR